MAVQRSAERLQKVLAQAGLGSRREIEDWIQAGRISINGKLARLGDRITGSDRIKVDNREINLKTKLPALTKVLGYYKQEGEVCTRKDPEGRTTVFEKLPQISKGQWISIGRLDINTSGLLLFTTDGELANRMMHPSGMVEREYAVRVLGQASEQQLNNLLNGVELDDGTAAFTDIVDAGGRGANHWYTVVIMEGRNREVRRLWESQGLKVNRLIRVRFGPYILPRRKRPGQFWDLEQKDVEQLLTESGLASGKGKVESGKLKVESKKSRK
jgi:23S rRNA pseudouridine2605 synthase